MPSLTSYKLREVDPLTIYTVKIDSPASGLVGFFFYGYLIWLVVLMLL